MTNEKREKALEILRNDDDIFVEMVNELDAWNGYADGFRAYEMDALDDFFCNIKVSEFLDNLTADFNHNDAYFVYTIYGLDSTDDLVGLYRDNVDEDDLLDEIVDKKNHIYFSDSDFEELIDEIINGDESDDEPEEMTA